MANLDFDCDVTQGFNFQKDLQKLVGHIVSCQVGDEAFDSDFKVQDPEGEADAFVGVFGIVSGIYWNGGYADPIQFNCQVSNANKVKIATLTHKSLTNTEVTFKFNIYDFDPTEKKYYKCFHTDDADLKGLVMKSGGELVMNISMNQSDEITSPKNFAFNLGVMPQEGASADLMVATSVSDKFVKKWGVEVSA